ncbi:MAG TPA: aconitase family protein, partial [Actinomycetota bacterium]
WPKEISYALVGSCTNSSYEDITRAASIAREAAARGLTCRTDLMITPGSEQVRATIERDGLLADFERIGATVLANACGPCIGQWSRSDVSEGDVNTIVTSYNRNFPKRNDGLSTTFAFVTSPETVVALAIAGSLDFDPLTDTLTNDAGEEVRLSVPVGVELPDQGFTPGESGFIAPPADGSGVSVAVSPTSDRLQILEPFAPWNGQDFIGLPVLMKASGKCTTDHISAAGPWLKYRGHLENISGNLFAGAVNAFTGAAGTAKDRTDDQTRPYPEIAKRWGEAGTRWIAIGDENYGEGSSREHAAMEPRFRGAAAVITRSFARIHEANLKKQGVLAFTFADPSDYDKIGEDDSISLLGLAELAPDVPVQGRIDHADGMTTDIELLHTMSPEQIEWFRAGSALNIIRQNTAN